MRNRAAIALLAADHGLTGRRCRARPCVDGWPLTLEARA